VYSGRSDLDRIRFRNSPSPDRFRRDNPCRSNTGARRRCRRSTNDSSGKWYTGGPHWDHPRRSSRRFHRSTGPSWYKPSRYKSLSKDKHTGRNRDT
jgi:hypothetical protein